MPPSTSKASLTQAPQLATHGRWEEGQQGVKDVFILFFGVVKARQVAYDLHFCRVKALFTIFLKRF